MTESKDLKTMFPAREVSLYDGTIVTVTPLTLENLPKVADSFGILMKHAEDGVAPSEIAAKALGEVLKIVPYCIDISPDKVLAGDVPDILEIVVEQNVTKDIVGKWTSLVQKVMTLAGGEELDETLKKKKKK
jgi:hypothetical protein